jgi:hypothetical protein
VVLVVVVVVVVVVVFYLRYIAFGASTIVQERGYAHAR